MKKVIVLIISIIVVFLTIFISCSKSTIIDIAIPRTVEDTSTYTPRVKSDTVVIDTIRVPISFDVTVDNWVDEEEINF